MEYLKGKKVNFLNVKYQPNNNNASNVRILGEHFVNKNKKNVK